MTVYVDSSVLVRIIAGQARPLKGWESIEEPLASVLIEIEVPRAIERLRSTGALSDAAAVAAAERGRIALRAFRLMEIEPAVRLRASGPFAIQLRTLDAIHVASALLWREAYPHDDLTLATHDERVAMAARAHGLRVIGCPEVRA